MGGHFWGCVCLFSKSLQVSAYLFPVFLSRLRHSRWRWGGGHKPQELKSLIEHAPQLQLRSLTCPWLALSHSSPQLFQSRVPHSSAPLPCHHPGSLSGNSHTVHLIPNSWGHLKKNFLPRKYSLGKRSFFFFPDSASWIHHVTRYLLTPYCNFFLCKIGIILVWC